MESNPQKICIIRNFRPSTIKKDISTKLEYQYLISGNIFEPLQQLGVLNHSLTFTLLNVHSLKNPFHDISIDKDLNDLDLLFPTENQLQERDNLDFIESHFSETFTISFINNDNKYSIATICYRQGVYLLKQQIGW